MMKQIQSYVYGEWRDVSLIDYDRDIVVLFWEGVTDVYCIKDVELRFKEETK